MRTRMGEGTEIFLSALRGLSPSQFDEPSLLPGWTRKHVAAHTAANAEALQNLVHWAATGEERPMYTSPEQRNADIEAGATRSAEALVEWNAAAAEQLAVAYERLEPGARHHQVRTAQGRQVPVSEIEWMRTREVMVHAVDLDAGVGFDDLPPDFLAAFIDEIVARRSSTEHHPTLTLTDGEQQWTIAPTPAASAATSRAAGHDGAPIRGSRGDIAAYLSGRPHALAGPTLPRWL